MPVKKTITQLIAAMRREFISGYQSMFIIIYLGLAAQINALPILRLWLYATGEKPTASKIAMASLPVR